MDSLNIELRCFKDSRDQLWTQIILILPPGSLGLRYRERMVLGAVPEEWITNPFDPCNSVSMQWCKTIYDLLPFGEPLCEGEIRHIEFILKDTRPAHDPTVPSNPLR